MENKSTCDLTHAHMHADTHIHTRTHMHTQMAYGSAASHLYLCVF